MKIQRLIAPAILAVALSLMATTTVSAHAHYKSSTPATGEIVSASPARVQITFTQDIKKVAGTYGINVAIDGGPPVLAGTAVVNDAERSQLSVDLQPNLSPGRYIVRWKNVSDDDSDPAEGAFSFYLGVRPTAANLASDTDLEAIGAEVETPEASAPAGATVSVGAATAVQSPGSGSTIGTATSTPAAAANKSDDGSNIGLYAAIGIVAAVLALGGVSGLYAMSRRGT